MVKVSKSVGLRLLKKRKLSHHERILEEDRINENKEKLGATERKLSYTRYALIASPFVFTGGALAWWKLWKRPSDDSPPSDSPVDSPPPGTIPPGTTPSGTPPPESLPPGTTPPAEDGGIVEKAKSVWNEYKPLIIMAVIFLLVILLLLYYMSRLKRANKQLAYEIMDSRVVLDGVQLDPSDIVNEMKSVRDTERQLGELVGIKMTPINPDIHPVRQHEIREQMRKDTYKAVDNLKSDIRAQEDRIEELKAAKKDVVEIKGDTTALDNRIKELTNELSVLKSGEKRADRLMNILSSGEGKIADQLDKTEAYLKKVAREAGVPEQDTSDFTVSKFEDRIKELTSVVLADRGVESEEAADQLTVWVDAMKRSSAYKEEQKRKAEEFLKMFNYGGVDYMEKAFDSVKEDLEHAEEEGLYNNLKTGSGAGEAFFKVIRAEDLEQTRTKQKKVDGKVSLTEEEVEKYIKPKAEVIAFMSKIEDVSFNPLALREKLALWHAVKDINFKGKDKNEAEKRNAWKVRLFESIQKDVNDIQKNRANDNGALFKGEEILDMKSPSLKMLPKYGGLSKAALDEEEKLRNKLKAEAAKIAKEEKLAQERARVKTKEITRPPLSFLGEISKKAEEVAEEAQEAVKAAPKPFKRPPNPMGGGGMASLQAELQKKLAQRGPPTV